MAERVGPVTISGHILQLMSFREVRQPACLSNNRNQVEDANLSPGLSITSRHNIQIFGTNSIGEQRHCGFMAAKHMSNGMSHGLAVG